MPKALSGDLRERVIEAVEAGASRREAAERFEISASSAVKWLQCWRDHGVCAPKPRGGSRSVLEDYAERILALVTEQPDRTLDEIVAAMQKRRIPGSRSALWRFLDRHGITFKKACGRPSSTERTWRERGGAAHARLPSGACAAINSSCAPHCARGERPRRCAAEQCMHS